MTPRNPERIRTKFGGTWQWLKCDLRFAPVRFRDREEAEHAYTTGDMRKGLHPGDEGYADCDFEVRWLIAD